MPLNSVNTNIGAMVALQSLNKTNDDMAVTQKRISTGLRVADAKDDGAAFAVAQKVRANVAGLTSANEQLGSAKGVVDTTLSSLNAISSKMGDIQKTLVKLADAKVVGDERTAYADQFKKQVAEVDRFILDSTYNGYSLLNTAAQTATKGDITTVRNEVGATFTISQVATADNLTFSTAANPATAVAAPTQAQAQAMLDGASTGAGAPKNFKDVMTAIGNALNQLGNDSNAVDAQITYNKSKMDALETGIGALVDADLAKESAKLQSLQIRQQLGTQSLSIANQAPQSLLSLFR